MSKRADALLIRPARAEEREELEELQRRGDPADDPRDLRRPHHLQAGKAVFRPFPDLEKLVREAHDLVPGRHGGRYSMRPGVWRSLVARSVRVGEVPSSNLGTPI